MFLPENSFFKTTIFLAYYRDLFKGDLNILQYLALNYYLNKSREEEFNLEQERMKYTLLSGNPSLYKSLYEDKSIEDAIPGEIKWITPRSAEEMEELISMIEGTNVEYTS